MKKGIVAVACLALVVICYAVAQAQGPALSPQDAMRLGSRSSQTVDKRAMMAGMSQIMGLMQRQIVATTDGGVVILVGNKLLKYDKDLKLVKEADVTADPSALLQSLMEQLKQQTTSSASASAPASQAATPAEQPSGK
jgi:hypothetical protein